MTNVVLARERSDVPLHCKRVLLVIPTLLGAAALVFLLMRLIPGDICVVRLGSGGGSFDPRAVAAVPRRAWAWTGR